MVPLAMAAMVGVPALAQVLTGIWQTSQANKYKPGDRPTLTEPKSLLEEEYINRMYAGQTKAPQASLMEQNIEGSAAQALENVQRTGNPMDVLSSVGTIQGQKDTAMRGVGELNINYQQEAMRNLLATLGKRQQFDMQKFQVNQLDPWMEGAATYSAMKGAGGQNVMRGITGAASSALSLYMQNQLLDAYGAKKTGDNAILSLMAKGGSIGGLAGEGSNTYDPWGAASTNSYDFGNRPTFTGTSLMENSGYNAENYGASNPYNLLGQLNLR